MSEERPQFEPDADFFSNPESFVEPEPLDAFPPIEEESFVPPPPSYVPPASEAPSTAIPPRPSPKPAMATAAADKPRQPWGVYALLLLVGALAARVGLDMTKPKATPTPSATDGATATPSTSPLPAPTEPTPPLTAVASADEHKALVAKVEDLTKTLAGLRAKLDGMPKAAPAPAPDLKPIETRLAALDAKVADLAARPAPAPAPPTEPAPTVDLKPIEGKVADLAKSVAGLAAVKDQVSTLTERLSAQDKAIAALKTASTEKPAAPAGNGNGTSPTPATPASSTPAADIEGALAQAIGLFKGSQFGPARDAFVKLQATAPNDARVWYYSAMSNGFATNQWQEGSDTIKFVTRGIEREKAGTPDKAKLDAAFADLNANAKGWLDAYRDQAR